MVLHGGVAHARRSRVISAPPQAIWDVLADFGALSSWADNIDHSSVLHEHPEHVGTARRVQVGRNALVETITMFEPAGTLAYDIEGLPRRLGALENRWTLRPTGGATEVTVTSTVTKGSGPLARLVEQVVSGVIAKQSDVMLSGLARRMGGTP
ncbi:SRPBCC family protein [[Mycobacterium] wendilense]|uniref:SRPBCC family protein n=1 Tax=[Mycobacterium] wendilense TaxID=3064284 RepID=A0ABM9MCL9_9MYCO|nr:SRPBCC family protein [Mycolicibacterium sp. MU0050]CAJ1581960.1 SRPBCC family protein [Mycolicibacterium sp. MU0050]